MAVGIYVRVSTEEQRERQSILTQREFGSRYCDLHQLPVSATYSDDGVSGTVPIELRPGGIRLLEDARRLGQNLDRRDAPVKGHVGRVPLLPDLHGKMAGSCRRG